jgi:RNA polymerase sigma-70 factor (ECF subfamily)
MDEAAFSDLYARTARPLWGYLARTVGNAALADDLLQETYFRLLRADFVPESDAHARNFLFKVATNLVRDHFRSAKHRELPLVHGPTVAASQDRADLGRDLAGLLQRLKPRERQLLWLGHVEQLSHREIAQILGLKPASIRLLLFRARRKLAAALAEADLGPEVLA